MPTQLTSRTTDTSALGRPFGTIIHPVFMGAAMGSLGLLSFAFGLTLRRSLTKVTALAITAACVLCLYLSHTRAALVAFVIVMLGMIVVALAHQHLSWRTVGRVTLALLIGAAVFFPQLEARFEENFGTGHFNEEVTSRYQLNDLAGRMIADHPALGVGLNNFEVVMPPYENHGIIFINNPVHNLYLLYLAETGIVGLAGLLFVGISMYNVALRLARSRDRLLGGVGLGVSAAMAFLFIEELLGFSLRQDQPLALYWIFAGLAVACYRMSGLEGWRRPRRYRAAGRPGRGGTSRGGDGPGPDSVWVPAYAAGRPSRWRHRHRRRPTTVTPTAAATRSRSPRRARLPVVASAHRAPRRRRPGPRRAHARGRAPDPTAVDRSRTSCRAELARSLRSLPAIPTVGTPRPATDQPPAARRDRGRSPAPTAGARHATVVPPSRSSAGRRSAACASVSRSSWWPRCSAPGLQQSQRAQASTSVPISQMKIVFSATSLPIRDKKFVERHLRGQRRRHRHARAAAAVRRTGNPLYNWPQWALGGTKIIFTVRNGPSVSSEDRLRPATRTSG